MPIVTYSVLAIMAAMEREAKLRKLHAMKRKVPHMTAAALSGLLQEVHEHGSVDLFQRKHVREATEHHLEQFQTYGSLIKTVELVACDGSMLSIPIINLFSLIGGAYGQGGGFTALIEETLRTCPNSVDEPWSILLYTDEIVPGNPLSHENRRKVTVVYVSFLQFGSIRLSQECSWLTLACVRSSVLGTVKAGLSQLIKVVVKDVFQSNLVDLSHGGLLLKGPNGNRQRLWLKLGGFVQDGLAHKQMMSIKGDNGTRCCVLCKNIVSKNSGLLDEEGTELLHTELVTESSCDFTTDEDLWSSISRLKKFQAELILVCCQKLLCFVLFLKSFVF